MPCGFSRRRCEATMLSSALSQGFSGISFPPSLSIEDGYYNNAEAVDLSIEKGSSQTSVHRSLLFIAFSLERSEAWGYMIKHIDTQ